MAEELKTVSIYIHMKNQTHFDLKRAIVVILYLKDNMGSYIVGVRREGVDLFKFLSLFPIVGELLHNRFTQKAGGKKRELIFGNFLVPNTLKKELQESLLF